MCSEDNHQRKRITSKFQIATLFASKRRMHSFSRLVYKSNYDLDILLCSSPRIHDTLTRPVSRFRENTYGRQYRRNHLYITMLLGYWVGLIICRVDHDILRRCPTCVCQRRAVWFYWELVPAATYHIRLVLSAWLCDYECNRTRHDDWWLLTSRRHITWTSFSLHTYFSRPLTHFGIYIDQSLA